MRILQRPRANDSVPVLECHLKLITSPGSATRCPSRGGADMRGSVGNNRFVFHPERRHPNPTCCSQPPVHFSSPREWLSDLAGCSPPPSCPSSALHWAELGKLWMYPKCRCDQTQRQLPRYTLPLTTERTTVVTSSQTRSFQEVPLDSLPT